MSSSRSLTCTKLTLITASCVMIQIVGLSLFIMGFFPVKPSLSGMSGSESFYPPGSEPADSNQEILSLTPQKIKSLYQELSGVLPLYDRLILMVIDGLPAEFVLGKHGNPPQKRFFEAMPYTQSLLTRGLAIGYHAKAAPPTVTMPRLKAMVSGAIGGFLDVATNFNTQAFLDDNLIAQFLRIGWKMVMLGDDTWLKLFPNMFIRQDGVNSFFVKDTIQVDYNVSRHLTSELNQTDWDLLILHYLGLDHVGHIGGRNSILMCPKLSEMDEVIRRIHSSITQSERGTLLVVVSDHGMTESGNHGGSSYEETDSLALFVSTQELLGTGEQRVVNQVDVASTLALLFGVPIPKNNVGTFMSETFRSLQEDEQYLKVLERNSWQLLRLLNTHLSELGCREFSCGKSGTGKKEGVELFCCYYLDAIALHESWKSLNSSRRSSNEDGYKRIVLAYNEFLRGTSKWLSSKSTDKSTGLLVLGIIAMLISCLGLIHLLFQLNRAFNSINRQQKWELEEIFSTAVIFFLVLSMGSSSMVEEEHYIWHFMTSSFFLLLLRKTILAKRGTFSPFYCVITLLVSGRILRGWHQGGVNWTHLPDLSKLLERAGPAYINYLQVLSLSLVVIVLCFTFISAFQFKKRIFMALISMYLLPASMILTQVVKIEGSSFISGANTAIQLIYAFLGASSLGTLVLTPWLMPPNTFEDSIRFIGWCYVSSWCLLQILLQQPVNAVPVSLLLVQIVAGVSYFSDEGLHLKQWVKVAAFYYMAMAGHFSLGNTNTLATIDVAGAFIGISSHSTVISGILMFMITYASPMLYLLGTMTFACCNKARDLDYGSLMKMALGFPCLVPLAINSVILLAYTIVLLLMRNHLFVWSVFSPKYLYVCATTVCVYVGASIVALSCSYTCTVFAARRRLN